jgi:hypothetical protein
MRKKANHAIHVRPKACGLGPTSWRPLVEEFLVLTPMEKIIHYDV